MMSDVFIDMILGNKFFIKRPQILFAYKPDEFQNVFIFGNSFDSENGQIGAIL